MNSSRLRIRSFGLTLLELLVTVAITAILAALAAPSMREWMMAQRVKSTAAELATDIHFTRGEGVVRNRDMQITFKSDSTKNCYTIHTTTGFNDCNCLSDPPCTALGFAPVKIVSILKSTQVLVSADPAAAYFRSADSMKAQPPTAITITGLAGQSLQVNISAVSRRPSICAPSGSTITGYPPCQ